MVIDHLEICLISVICQMVEKANSYLFYALILTIEEVHCLKTAVVAFNTHCLFFVHIIICIWQ